MTNTSKNYLDALLRHGIGVGFDFFEKSAEAPNFPPHNIVQLDDYTYQLTLAVAGFEIGELQIIREADILTVSGHKVDEPDKVGRQVLYRGIAFRDFSRQFKIGDNVQVQDVTLRNGLLLIALIREIPEARKPIMIQISA